VVDIFVCGLQILDLFISSFFFFLWPVGCKSRERGMDTVKSGVDRVVY